MNRRDFLAGTAAAAAVSTKAARGGPQPERSEPPPVVLLADPKDPVVAASPVQHALARLEATLRRRGVDARRIAQASWGPSEARRVVVSGPGATPALGALGPVRRGEPESFALVPGSPGGRATLQVYGGDAKGLAYALLDLADRAQHAQRPVEDLANVPFSVERPANPVRGVMRCFVSELEDKPWFLDRASWERYLDLLATHRFNRFQLAFGIGYDFLAEVTDAYLHFAYPFLLDVPGYDVRVPGLPNEERQRNLATLRYISDAAAKRGLHFQLGLWTHGYAWEKKPGVNYTVEGLTPESHASYCRDALAALLKACPAIQGVTFRIHGESGVGEGQYGFWRTVFDGIVRSGRRLEIDMHAKGIDQQMIDVGLATGMPVHVSPKFWAEHMGLPYHQASIRSLEMPSKEARDEGFFSKSNGSRRFLRYGYGDLLAEDRPYGVFFRLWPGTQRLLLWGYPAMAAAFSRAAGFCGSAGLELFEPLSFKGRKGSGIPGGRDAYADAALKSPRGDFEKYAYTYRVWGRFLYHPDAAPEGWQRARSAELGVPAELAEAALWSASRILPLVTTAHDPSAANNSYWPEMYTDMPVVDAHRQQPYGDTPAPKRFGTVSPLDPELFATVEECAAALLAGEPLAKYSPLEVADWLETLAIDARRHLADAEARAGTAPAPAFCRLAVDVVIQSGLGRFFAAKMLAGVLWTLYERSGSAMAREEALKAYRAAREAWAQLARRSEGVYVKDITFGRVANLRGHWSDRLAAIDQNIADLEQHAAPPPDGATAHDADRALHTALTRQDRPPLRLEHTSPAPFRRGDAVTITAYLPVGGQRPASVSLRYRRVNQIEPWLSAPMEVGGDSYHTSIPGDYTRTPFPLQYYFKLRGSDGRVALFPGLGADLCGQPYYILRQNPNGAA